MVEEDSHNYRSRRRPKCSSSSSLTNIFTKINNNDHHHHNIRSKQRHRDTINISLLTLSILTIISTCFIDFAQNQNQYQSSTENHRDTCGKCFTTSQDHAWCYQESFSPDGSKTRCDTKNNLIKAGCPEAEIFRPGADMSVVPGEDKALSNMTSHEEDPIQLSPQRIKLRLPPNLPHTITLHYRQVKDYPVDLYYLMDLSNSMLDDKEKLAKLGNQISENMSRITSNFRLGFGSFVDKVLMPYVSTIPEKLEHPCRECTAPYGFRNHMPLTTDTSRFTQEVAASQISGNLDAPEGGFDAIMQSMVCQEQINWRPKSRKMLVFTTDASSHHAGDGKLAGVITPNDGQCHLDKTTGLYTESSEQDYPTLSQIDQKAQEHKVNLIFAVTSNQVPTYERLSSLIEGSSTGRLDNDSSNIVTLIEKQYHDITSTIELKDNATSNIQMSYHSACLNGDKKRETNTCNGLKVGSTISFDITLKVKSCPKRASEYNQVIQVYPVGLNESLFIDLEIICDCDCEKPQNVQEHSDKCSGHGTLVCGICVCDPFYYGRDCKCNAKDSDPAKDMQACFRYQNDTRPCSSRGQCFCGHCECTQRKNEPESFITGQFCECDNFSCLHHEGKMCSGPDHGVCKCGVCDCLDGWSGPDCHCKKSQDSCIHPKSGLICAGHGKCECGQCICDKFEDRHYAGDHCELCPNCPTMCEQYKDCVQCKAYNMGPLMESATPGANPATSPLLCDMCTNSTFSIKNTTKLDPFNEDEVHCVFDDDEGCTFQFKYKLTGSGLTERTDIHALQPKSCRAPFPFFLILLALALAILLLGLLGLLLWKCLTMWKDRREIAEFEKGKLEPQWGTGENKIYKEPISVFTNPTYTTYKTTSG